MKKRNIVSLFLIIVGFSAFLLWILAKAYEVGGELTSISVYLEYFYYVAVSVIAYLLLVRPFLIVMFSPSFSLDIISHKLTGEQKRRVIAKNYKQLRKYANRLVNKKLISDENIELVKNELKRKDGTLKEKYLSIKKLLDNITTKDLKKDIRKIVVNSARDTLYLTSLSQNGFIDVLVVVINNFRMLKRIVVRCGFRPSFLRLFKFYVNVSLSSLIADGSQKMDYNALLGNSLKGITKPIVGSLLDGLVNAFFMLRSGFLARNYIFDEFKDEKEKMNVMNSAFVEAAAALPELTVSSVLKPISDALVGTIVNPTKKVVKTLFSKEKEDILEEVS